MPLHSGYVLHGSHGTYNVERLLSEGGMGRIFVGNSPTGEKIIIKEPKYVGDTYDDVRLEKLVVEAQILSGINHKNIVRYIDHRDERPYKGPFYLVLQFVPGKTMKDAFWKKPVDEEETKNYALTLLDILKYIHSKNIIHRDLNPKNVLLPSNLPSEIVLIDFGAAKHNWTQLLSFGHTIVGTPNWSAPEQFSGLVTPKCDLYSVGATMFFLLTGHPPGMHIKADGTVEFPGNVRVSDHLSKVVLTAMDSDPSRRFETAEDMINEIKGRSAIHTAPCIFCKGSKYEITKTLTIGRLPQCEIFIDDPQQYISRQHAEVYEEKGSYWIEDKGSTNGTFVYQQGKFQRIKKWELRGGDFVALCYTDNKGPYITLSFSMGTHGRI